MFDENSVLVAVDMQNDFITGALGTPRARIILERVCELAATFPGDVVYTLDTHDRDYLSTYEGTQLPIEHCIKGTQGWRVPDRLMKVLSERRAHAFEKSTFASISLADALRDRHAKRPISAVELVGLCTDICVVSCALLLRATIPEVPLAVDASCCAGSDPQGHSAALKTMKSCQVLIRNADR
ncbi:isochorismatase hydrolase [Coriobacterium glomerans PW2]|uniref:nicotinamidase n=1 Tax=Coriobacterium glomerans (strain ATCC 49209 / DSM 20642 / JCM 10262 / PW2) TaxID=700015 RepID=F2NAG6_CORGP|nr:isochorismatase family cysteine hydrolase [Coriobacterium glomerans]AEB06493.1 isochorismatase hydrolase [Coriobacterium glomerans PW2]